MKVLLISPFGRPAYGVSPYADSLVCALRDSPRHRSADKLIPLDFQSAYPKLLYPASMPARRRESGIHWAKPWTWQSPETCIDVAHLQYWTAATAPYLLRLVHSLRKKKIKVITTHHNIQPHERYGVMAYFEDRLLRQSDRIISHLDSSDIRERVGEQLEIIPHGILFRTRRRPNPDDYNLTGLDPKKRYCLYFGNIRPYKGVLDLLRAWRDLSRSFPQHELLIAGRLWAGQGPAARIATRILGIHRFAQEYNLAKINPALHSVHFFDEYLSEEFIDACCRMAELSIFPYQKFDSQSGAATRVAGFGRRLLVSRSGALPKLVNDSRFTFAPGDIAELKSRLSALMSDTPERIATDEASQLEHLKTSSWESVANQHWDLYRRIGNTT